MGQFDGADAVEALAQALAIQVGVGRELQPDQLALPSPCEGWSVSDVIEHSLGVTLKFASFARGATDAPKSPPTDGLLGAGHREALESAAETARQSWAAADMTRTCHLSFGVFPADVAALINMFDVLAHTSDMAAPTGLVVDCPDALWRLGLAVAQRVVGPERDLRQFANEVSVPAAASPRAQFLAYLGRPIT